MRLAYLPSAFQPGSSRGLDQHTVSLAQALERAGIHVEVFAPRAMPGLAPLAQRRELVGGVWVTWCQWSEQTPLSDWSLALGAFLDRESPDLVHIESWPGTGEELVEVVSSRGIPCIHNANDWGAIAVDPHCLSVDLNPYAPDDFEAQARSLLVHTLLAQHPALGKHDNLLLPGLVEPEFWEHLQTLLKGPEAVGLDAARDRVRKEHAQRSLHYQSLQARFASSPHLASGLEVGLQATCDVVHPGVDLAPFANLVPPRTGRGPVRFGYLGDMAKSQGVHLLLDAFEGLSTHAELRLFGSGDDRLYLRTLRARAQEVGARWYGALEPGERPQAFDRIDVLVVPTLWQESVPHVVREAFAARRPVLVAHSEAACGNVLHEQNGLVFEPGNMGALRAAMQQFLREPEWLNRLELGIQPPRDIGEEAREWADIYARTKASVGSRIDLSQVPPHLTPLAERYQALQGLSTRELFDKVTRGIKGLSARMGVDLDPSTAVSLAVSMGGHGRDSKVSFRRMQRWLEGNALELQTGRQQLVEQEAKLREDRQSVSDQAQRLRLETEKRERELEELRLALRKEQAEREALRRRFEIQENEMSGALRLRSEEQAELVKKDQTMRMGLSLIARKVLPEGEAAGQEGEPLPSVAVEPTLKSLHALLRRNAEELIWRRKEMAKAKTAASGFLSRWVGGEASEMMRHWDEIPTPQAEWERDLPPAPADQSENQSKPQDKPNAEPSDQQQPEVTQ